MIRIEAVWLAVDPMDMRAGTDSALARVVQVFGAARPHHAYLFANRMKVLVHDGVGVYNRPDAASQHFFQKQTFGAASLRPYYQSCYTADATLVKALSIKSLPTHNRCMIINCYLAPAGPLNNC